jgi:hypothetical protein
MPRVFLALVLLPLAAVAAPMPKPVKTLADLYGEVTDPKGSCAVEMSKAGVLTLTVPGTADAVPLSKVASRRPVVGKLVEGDFVVTARVSATLPVVGDTPARAETPAAAVGVGVFSQKDGERKEECVMGALGGFWMRGKWRVMWMDGRWSGREGGWATEDCAAEPGSPVHVRLTRRGDTLTQERSPDGTKWVKVSSGSLPGPVCVGPVAFQCTTGEFVATVDEYELKELPKVEKK